MNARATSQPRTRIPIARVGVCRLGNLATAERARLTDACYELWSEFFEGMAQARFVETHLFDDTYLGFAEGVDGRLAAFYNVNLLDLVVAGERVMIMTSGVFIRLEYAASFALKRGGFRLALRLRLRHPFTRFVWVPIATTPVAYRNLAKSSRRFYPHPNLPTPNYVAPVLAEMCRHRKLVVDPENPFVVEFGIRQRRIDQLRRSARMQQSDAFMRHFIEMTPNWERGRALMALVPLDLRSLLDSAIMLARRPKL